MTRCCEGRAAAASGLRGILLEQPLHGCIQRRKVALDGSPDPAEIDLEVVVNQYISHPRDLPPGDGGIGSPQVFTEVLGGLADMYKPPEMISTNMTGALCIYRCARHARCYVNFCSSTYHSLQWSVHALRVDGAAQELPATGVPRCE